MAKQNATVFVCRECNYSQKRWVGKCPECGAMGSFEERAPEPENSSAAIAAKTAPLQIASLQAAKSADRPRVLSDVTEFDRVCGGGMAQGAAIVLGGEPGIGKSTLLAQVSAGVANNKNKVCYLSAEESPEQVRDRFIRLSYGDANVDLACSTSCDSIVSSIHQGNYDLIIIDSIQMLQASDASGAPGSPSQVRYCANLLIEAAKKYHCILVIVGHVTKDGTLAGPRLLEHAVDTVLQFEGDRYQDFRSLRALKNRFGSCAEVGLLSMQANGLQAVHEPGTMFLSGHHQDVPGSCIVPALEGRRCVMVEVQALVNSSEMPQPARKFSGLDNNRCHMIIAVLSRRLGIALGRCDIFLNATGGARIQEPAADLAIALALISAYEDRALAPEICALGEIGLGGELRSAGHYDLRRSEAARLGFKKLIGPGTGSGRGRVVCNTLQEARQHCFQ